jgi:hypothetical protein
MLRKEVVQIVTPAIKKRNRDPLSSNSHSERYEAISQVQDHYGSCKSVTVTAEKAVRRHNSARKAVYESRKEDEYSDNNQNYPQLDGHVNKRPGYYNERRVAIKHVYEAVFGAPPEENWHDMNLISVISHLLNIPSNSHTRVLEILRLISKEEKQYNGNVQKGAGKEALILHGTVQANLVYRSLQQGLSSKETTCILNMFREKLDPPEEPLSRSAVQGFMLRSDCIKTRKRQLKKSGTHQGAPDPSAQDGSGAPWCRRRPTNSTRLWTS